MPSQALCTVKVGAWEPMEQLSFLAGAGLGHLSENTSSCLINIGREF